LNSGPSFEPLHQRYFCEGFFEIGSLELFAQAGFKPRSFPISAYWVARITGLSHQHLACVGYFWVRVLLSFCQGARAGLKPRSSWSLPLE
jgi:hypothetical protein